MQFLIDGDWITIEKLADDRYNVIRDGNGEYEQYEIDRAGVERLKEQATGEII